MWQKMQFVRHVISAGFLPLTSVGARITPDPARLFTLFVDLYHKEMREK